MLIGPLLQLGRYFFFSELSCIDLRLCLWCKKPTSSFVVLHMLKQEYKMIYANKDEDNDGYADENVDDVR